MRKLSWLTLGLGALVCGGCGGGLSLSGGSIPPAGSAVVVGAAVLPSGQALNSATVSVRSVVTGQTYTASISFSNGSFAIGNVPTGQDMEIVFEQGSSATLKVVIPKSQLVTSRVNIGTVDAFTTVVATSIEDQASIDPSNASTFVASQYGQLNSGIASQGPSTAQQNQAVSNPQQCAADASSLLAQVASGELSTLASNPTNEAASAALDGMIGYVEIRNASPVHLTAADQTALITAQLAGTTYTPAQLAAALKTAGLPGSVSGVTQSDTSLRTQLPGFTALGSGISAFESLAVAIDATQPSTPGAPSTTLAEMESYLTALGL